MTYYKEHKLKDGRILILRNGEKKDAEGVLNNFIKTHAESDYLLTYPEECTFTVEKEGMYLEKKKESEREIEIVAIVDDRVVGTAGVDAIGNVMKLKHRCSFGVSVEKAYWGLGIGRALTNASIECAKTAGYLQMELDVVKDNERAVKLYESLGFETFGENEMGFKTRDGKYQSLVLMRKVL